MSRTATQTYHEACTKGGYGKHCWNKPKTSQGVIRQGCYNLECRGQAYCVPTCTTCPFILEVSKSIHEKAKVVLVKTEDDYNVTKRACYKTDVDYSKAKMFLFGDRIETKVVREKATVVREKATFVREKAKVALDKTKVARDKAENDYNDADYDYYEARIDHAESKSNYKKNQEHFKNFDKIHKECKKTGDYSALKTFATK